MNSTSKPPPSEIFKPLEFGRLCTKAKIERDLRACKIKETINLAKTDQIHTSKIEDISDSRIKEILNEVRELTTYPDPIKPIINNTSIITPPVNSSKNSIVSESEDIVSILEKDLLISDSEDSETESTSAPNPSTVVIHKPEVIKKTIETAIQSIKESNTNKWSAKIKSKHLSDIKKRAEQSE